MSSSQHTTSATAPQQSHPLDLIPVLLKEAALDSPTFRAAVYHFTETLDVLVQGLENFAKTASHLAAHASSLEKSVQEFLHAGTTLSAGSEGGAVWDPDYAPWAIKKWGESTREYWTGGVLPRLRAQESGVADPIRGFLANDLRAFRDVRRALEVSQKSYDATLARYAAQSKSKEPSALREEAFQVYEARKAYWKCGLDFGVLAPAVRVAVDRVVVKVFCGEGGERVRAWARGLEDSERVFRREVAVARKRIEEAAWSRGLPSRELEEYAANTVPYLGGTATTAAVGEKGGGGGGGGCREGSMQGWLFLKTIAGKAPPRTVWSRRWFYVRGGVFGWLFPGARGGVEESEKVGVLLCSVRPAFQEERRFCFEVKTKDSGVVVQAETQVELMEWIAAFEMAKRQALEGTTMGGLAFAVTPPVAPEFAAMVGDQHAEEVAAAAAEGGGGLPLAARPSFDVTSMPAAKRVVSLAADKSGDSSSDGGGGGGGSAARIMQRLDLHKRSNASQSSSSLLGGSSAGGGIASLISASHSSMPIGPGALPSPLPAALTTGLETGKRNFNISSMSTITMSSLAPNTLANPPAPTYLSLAAVAVGGGTAGAGVGAGVLANMWGSCEWGVVNRLGYEEEDEEAERMGMTAMTTKTKMEERGALSASSDRVVGSVTPVVPVSRDDSEVMDGHGGGAALAAMDIISPSTANLIGPRHRKTLSAATPDTTNTPPSGALVPIPDEDTFPASYPPALQAQQAQFRLLFPTAPRGPAHHLVLVFRATWNPHDRQEFPGRVYVTPREMFFYAHHLGLVLTTAVRLRSITDVTGAPGREGDMVFLHLGEGKGRVTVKVFLEELGLLLRRLRFLVQNAQNERPEGVEEVVKTLVRLEAEDDDDEIIEDDRSRETGGVARNVTARLRVDGSLSARTGRELAGGALGGQKFRLPAHPVVYVPKGMHAASVTREVPVSAKALFHVLFGDKSVVFRTLYGTPTVWVKEAGNWTRRFASHGGVQTIDVLNEHLCYVVTHSHHPLSSGSGGVLVVMTKYVLTHTAKSKCTFAVYQHFAWPTSSRAAPRWRYIRRLIERDVLRSLDVNARALADVATEQVGRLEGGSKTTRAVDIFGDIGGLGSMNPTVVPALEAAGRAAVPRHSVVRLVADDLAAHFLAALGWVGDVGMAGAKRVWGVWSAHAFLVVLLGFSAVWNVWFGYRDGVGWWRERDAMRFLARMGVAGTGTGSGERRVFLGTGVEEILGPALSGGGLWVGNGTGGVETAAGKNCRTTFEEQVVLLTTSTSIPKEEEEAGLRRLRRTREALARYRHDLLVAVRVVDRIERVAVEEEWEEWVRAEGRKCARVEGMLREARRREGAVDGGEEVGRELGEEFWAYCRSCRIEEEGLAR